MNKPTIHNLIIVEGQHDKSKILSIFNANVIITDGYNVSNDLVTFLIAAKKKQELIILTDPDNAGRDIAKKLVNLVGGINIEIPLNKINKAKKGVAEADDEIIYNALKQYVSNDSLYQVNKVDLYNMGYIGQRDSKLKRDKICAKFSLINRNIGDFCTSLNVLQISKKELYDNQ